MVFHASALVVKQSWLRLQKPLANAERTHPGWINRPTPFTDGKYVKKPDALLSNLATRTRVRSLPSTNRCKWIVWNIQSKVHISILSIRSPELLLISTRGRCCSIGQPFSRSMAFRPWKRNIPSNWKKRKLGKSISRSKVSRWMSKRISFLFFQLQSNQTALSRFRRAYQRPVRK